MNRLITAAVCAAITAGFLPAQEQSVRANVPFEFHVCNRLLPAGNYAVDKKDAAILLREPNTGRAICFVLSHGVTGKGGYGGSERKMVFDHVGTEYFLRSVYDGTSATGQELPVSSGEKELLAKGARTEHAILALNRK
jgi:hypothetical protein